MRASRIRIAYCFALKRYNMRISQHFNLGRTQSTLSFVDVDVDTDVPLFISPRALKLLPDAWGHECVSLIQGFFGKILNLIRRRRHAEAVSLLQHLREPNETHLGLSKGKSRGRGLGSNKAEEVWASLSQSKAISSGLVTDLEDTVLMVDNVSNDIVSDIVTNLIRGPLITFTQQACAQYGIPLTQDVDSGPIWVQADGMWVNRYEALPEANGSKLLLVPKIIVRHDMDYDVDKYYRKHILEHLRQKEISVNSDLVSVIKTGKRKGQKRVFAKDLTKKYGKGKSVIVEQTLKNPQILKDYKKEEKQPSQPLSDSQLAGVQASPQPSFESLLDSLKRITPGRDGATQYEKNVEGLISALFYPVLYSPIFQNEIHHGRKRIDITYANMAEKGFFRWVAAHYPSSYIHFECKNYRADLANPELDQLSSRFAPNRGRVGVVVCRSFKDRNLWAKRCRDTAVDGRGFILTLDDADLSVLVEAKRTTLDFFELPLLRRQFSALTG